MQPDILRMVAVASVFCCVLTLVGPVLSFQDCPLECPHEFDLACAYSEVKNCYRVFENDCAIDLFNCYRPKSYIKTSMAECDNPALWCEHKNILQ